MSRRSANATSLAPDNIPPDPSSEAALFAWTLAQENMHLLVFVNGHFSSELSAVGELPTGARLESLADVLDANADLPQNYSISSMNILSLLRSILP